MIRYKQVTVMKNCQEENQINNVIPETNNYEDVYGVATLSSTFLKKKDSEK
jgi:hypothetical protein